jgi:hypothetical protein
VASGAAGQRRHELLLAHGGGGACGRPKFVVDKNALAAKRAAVALSKQQQQQQQQQQQAVTGGAGGGDAPARPAGIPQVRLRALVAVLERYFDDGDAAASEAPGQLRLEDARVGSLVTRGLALEPSSRDAAYEPVEKAVVAAAAAVAGSGGGDEEAQRAALNAWISQWRVLFVETLAPKHLPQGWSASHCRQGTHRSDGKEKKSAATSS